MAGLELGAALSDEEARALLKQEQALLGQQEEFIQGCMAKEGFSYFYEPPGEQLQRSVGFEHPYGTAEWAGRYGVGASTLLFTQDEVGVDLVGSPEPMVFPTADEANNPGDREFEALGEAGRAAYWKVLYGWTEDSAEVSQGDQDSSCYGQALAANPDQALLIELEWGETEILELRDRIEASGEVQDMLRLGALCVQADGFTSTSRSEAYNEIEEQIQVLFQIEPIGLGNPEFVEMLSSIQDYELDLSAALTKCGVGAQLEVSVREAVAIQLGYEMEILIPTDDSD